MSDYVCLGRCNATPRRRSEEHARALAMWQAEIATWSAADPAQRGPEPARPAEPVLRWMPGSPIWCLNDASAIRAALVDLDRQMTIQMFHADGYGSIDLNERVTSSPEPASPSNAHDQLDELVRWLRSWQRAYWETRGWPTPAYLGESAPALTEVTSALCAHLDGILAHPDYAADFGAGVLAWHSDVTAAAKTKPRRVAMQMRCPQCHLATLSRLEGEDRVECRNRDCGANRGGPVVLTVDEYHGLAADVIAASGRRAS